MSAVKVQIDFGDAIRNYTLKDDRKDLWTGKHCVLEFCHPDQGEIALFTLKEPGAETITNKEHAVVCAARQVAERCLSEKYEKYGDMDFDRDLAMVLRILTQKITELDQ